MRFEVNLVEHMRASGYSAALASRLRPALLLGWVVRLKHGDTMDILLSWVPVEMYSILEKTVLDRGSRSDRPRYQAYMRWTLTFDLDRMTLTVNSK